MPATKENQGAELSLRESLKGFAHSNTAERERMLPKLVAAISHETVTPNLLESWKDVKFEELLNKAVEAALRTTFVTWNGEKINPWEGGFTIAVMNYRGEIIGAASNPEGTLYEQLGSNLYPHTIWKGLFRLHLELSGRKGGLDLDDNAKYIQELLPNKNIYKGEALLEWTATFDKLVIGTSACELTAEYKDGLAPGMLKPGKESMNFVAGHAEMTFAEQVAHNLHHPDADRVVREPEFFSMLRRSH